MGQYYKVLNLDNGEYLSGSSFGDNTTKLLEWMWNDGWGLKAWMLLCATSNGMGNGDLQDTWDVDYSRRYDLMHDRGYSRERATLLTRRPAYLLPGGKTAIDADKIIGRWAGQRVIMCGDYTDVDPHLGGVLPGFMREDDRKDSGEWESPYAVSSQRGLSMAPWVMPILEMANAIIFKFAPGDRQVEVVKQGSGEEISPRAWQRGFEQVPLEQRFWHAWIKDIPLIDWEPPVDTGKRVRLRGTDMPITVQTNSTRRVRGF